MGLMVKEVLCENVMAVRRVSDEVMNVVVVLEEDLLRLICVYALQCGGSFEEKLSFHDDLQCE